MNYENPEIKDYGGLRELTLGCLGGLDDDTFGDVDQFVSGPSGALVCPDS